MCSGRVQVLNYFTRKNNAAPATIEASPRNLNWPSLSSITRMNVSRHAFGANSGISPSKTSINANPVNSVSVTVVQFAVANVYEIATKNGAPKFGTRR